MLLPAFVKVVTESKKYLLGITSAVLLKLFTTR